MSVHGQNGHLSIDDASGTLRNISPYLDSIDPSWSQDVHDDTTFGNTAHTKRGGLTDGSITISGLYDRTADVGVDIVLRGLIGVAVPGDFEYGPEGTTAGKPKESGKFVLESYSPSVPVADLIRFTATLQVSGAVTVGTYSA